MKRRKDLVWLGRWLLWIVGLVLLRHVITTPVPGDLLGDIWWNTALAFGVSLTVSFGDLFGVRRQCRCDRA